MINNFLAIFIGGGIGAILRYSLSLLCKSFMLHPAFGTFVANITGCFLMGYIFALTLNKMTVLPSYLKLFITVGFLGALTTFSTFSLEIFEFIKNDKIITALLYLSGSCIIGLISLAIGYHLGK